MSKPSKLYSNLLANPRQTLALRDFMALVEAFGFVMRRQRGSHRVYSHTLCPFVLNLQPKGSDAKHYQVSQFMAYVEEYGLELDP